MMFNGSKFTTKFFASIGDMLAAASAAKGHTTLVTPGSVQVCAVTFGRTTFTTYQVAE